MYRKVINDILQTWSKTYYINALAILCQLIALTAGIKFFRKENERIAFLVYIIFSILLFTVNEYIESYNELTGVSYDLLQIKSEKIEVLFEIVEFFTFYYFFHLLYAGKKIGRLLRVLSIFYILICIGFYIRIGSNSKLSEVWHTSFFISTIEMIFLAIPCFIYYYELFKNAPVHSLNNRPSFWIVTGLMLYSTIVIPFFVIASYFIETNFEIINYGFIIHFLLFSILFLFLTKAFSINKRLTD